MLDRITPLVITYNEEANIARTLTRLTWARRILVIDSGSDDATLGILGAHRNVEVVQRPFDSFARQCNFGLERIAAGWILSLDADYELSEALVAELAELNPPPDVAGYRARFVYRIFGRPLRGTLYPPRTVLYRAGLGRYRDEGHGHRVELAGKVRDLAAPIFHDDRKPLARWFLTQQSYARREAIHLLSSDPASLPRADRIRLRLWPAPFLVFVYTLLVKGALLDGWPGWFYALQRTYAEIGLALTLLDGRLRRNDTKEDETAGGQVSKPGSQ